MPRFYFDVDDGAGHRRDEDGVELTSLREARAEALETLAEIAEEELPDGDRRDFVIEVRHGSAEPALRASLSLRVETVLENIP